MRFPGGVFLQISTGGATHVGMVRTNNEDCYRIVSPAEPLCARGWNGRRKLMAEVGRSALAVETVLKHCLEGEENPSAPLLGEPKPELNRKSQRLLSAIQLANQKVFLSAEEHPEQQGMGATLTAAWD